MSYLYLKSLFTASQAGVGPNLPGQDRVSLRAPCPLILNLVSELISKNLLTSRPSFEVLPRGGAKSAAV